MNIPDDVNIRMFSENGRWFVGVARNGRSVDLSDVVTPGNMSALLTHDEGVSWPDRTGLALFGFVMMDDAGAVVLQFESLADAMACRKTLRTIRGES